jgi:hypothetical protein
VCPGSSGLYGLGRRGGPRLLVGGGGIGLLLWILGLLYVVFSMEQRSTGLVGIKVSPPMLLLVGGFPVTSERLVESEILKQLEIDVAVCVMSRENCSWGWRCWLPRVCGGRWWIWPLVRRDGSVPRSGVEGAQGVGPAGASPLVDGPQRCRCSLRVMVAIAARQRLQARGSFNFKVQFGHRRSSLPAMVGDSSDWW